MTTIPFEEAEDLPFTDPHVHHHMLSDTRHKIHLVQWVGENEDDPTMMVSAIWVKLLFLTLSFKRILFQDLKTTSLVDSLDMNIQEMKQNSPLQSGIRSHFSITTFTATKSCR